MTTNVYIQDSIEGYALLSDLASVFRGSSCWNGSQVTMVADIPGNEDGYVFTRSNIIGEFEYVAAAYPDRHTRAKVAWDNPENEFKTQPAPVTNEELIGALGHRMLDISRFGCTVEGEAIRHGIWALKSEQYEEWSVSFTTGMEGRNVEPGQIICVADETFSGRPNGGRISAATKRVITLDIDAPVQQEDRLILNLPSGKSEGRIVKSVSGRLVTVMADYSELPEPECSWSVESADLAVMRFRVQTIEPQGLHQFKISATQHEPQKYAAIDTGARIDPQPISIIPPGVMAPPANITLAARSVVSQGIAVTSMRITWESVPGAIAYNVEWRKDSGNWVRLPRTGSLGAEVEGIYSGRYVARVSSVNAMDVASIWGISPEVTLTGKTGLPPSVTHLTATSELFAIGLKWGFPAGAEDTQRTEIWYSPANNLEGATKLSDLAYPQSDYKLQGLAAGASFFFWARLVDRTGNIGPWYPATNGVLGQSSSDAGPILDLISGQITESELGQDLLEEIQKIPGLQQQIDSLDGLKDYNPNEAYTKDKMVFVDGRIYQAKQAVPANASGANGPPNATYWIDVGQSVVSANGLAQQVATNTADITELDGVVTAQATSLEVLRASYRDDGGAGAMADALKGWESTTAIASERRVQASENRATAERLTTFDAKVATSEANISQLERVVATNESATATKLDQLNTSVGQTNAAVQTTSQALAALDGKASTMWSVKMQVNAQDQYVAASVGMGIENGPGGLQSNFLVSADTFAVVNGINGTLASPFAVTGGQVFMNSAFIMDGTITNAKIGSYISSTNYVAGQQGWILNKSGTFEINGTVPGQGRLTMNNQRVRIYHANGNVAIDLAVNV